MEASKNNIKRHGLDSDRHKVYATAGIHRKRTAWNGSTNICILTTSKSGSRYKWKATTRQRVMVEQTTQTNNEPIDKTLARAHTNSKQQTAKITWPLDLRSHAQFRALCLCGCVCVCAHILDFEKDIHTCVCMCCVFVYPSNGFQQGSTNTTCNPKQALNSRQQ